jgi:hypothetical protein
VARVDARGAVLLVSAHSVASAAEFGAENRPMAAVELADMPCAVLREVVVPCLLEG